MITNNKQRLAYASRADALAALADLTGKWNCAVPNANVFQCEQCRRFHIDFEGVMGMRKPLQPVRLYSRPSAHVAEK